MPRTFLKNNKFTGHKLPDFKSYYIATIIKTCGIDIYITQQIKSPGGKKPYIYG